MKRVLSAIKPTGELHLGNYLGAVKNWIQLQDNYDAMFFIVDLHAITVPQDSEKLKRNTINMAKLYLALGLDPQKATLFVQSDVKEHAELCWILNCVARMGDMERMTQFKDKSQKEGRESATVGLYDYPVLMAADILLYDTDIVPVGDDQLQHVELTRKLARRFNKRYGDTFVVPKAKLNKEGKRIMGLCNYKNKMSKSSESEYDYISFYDSPDLIVKKIKKAVTDSDNKVVYSETKPAIKNLIDIYSLLSDISPKEVEEKFRGEGYGKFKEELSAVVVDFIKPIQSIAGSIDDDEVKIVLENGAKKARSIAKDKIELIKDKVGLGL